ncbi:HEAT repeat domain-containing protein [Patescibacteria group bacterium]|nr:HEAT repeat domain-containing protein [Patescibacteria group bacterium]
MQDNFYASFIVRDKAREMIHYVKDDNERVVLIKLCMENADPDVSAKAYEMMIQYLEDNEEKIVVIKKIMEDSDPDVREKAYEIIIKYVEDKEQRVLLIKKLMEDSDPDVREKVCDKMQQKKIIIDSDILLEKESH